MPGTRLPPERDDEAATLVATTLRRLHDAPADPSRFPSQRRAFDEWLARVRASGESGTAGVAMLDRATQSARQLDATTSGAVLLHGDFIDKNLVLGSDGYVALDPIPRIGDPCSDVGFYAAYHPRANGIAERASAVASRAGLDTRRALRWAAIWAVGEATETWREDSDELQRWVTSREATRLLAL